MKALKTSRPPAVPQPKEELWVTVLGRIKIHPILIEHLLCTYQAALDFAPLSEVTEKARREKNINHDRRS